MMILAVVSNPLYEFIQEMARKVEEKPDGAIGTEFDPSAQPGKIPHLIEGLQLGAVEFFGTPSGFLTGIDPRYQALGSERIRQPAACAQDHCRSGISPTVHQFRRLWGCRAAWSDFVRGREAGLADFRGQKFRVLATKVETEVMSKLGAASVPIPYTETIPAPQRKLIDGVRSNIVVMNATKHWTVAKLITVVNDTYIPSVGFISMVWYKNLPKKLQQVVDKAGREVEDYMYQVGQRFAARAERGRQDGGVELIRLSDADQKRFMEIVQPISDDVFGKRADTKFMFELVKKTAEKYRRN